MITSFRDHLEQIQQLFEGWPAEIQQPIQEQLNTIRDENIDLQNIDERIIMLTQIASIQTQLQRVMRMDQVKQAALLSL